MTREEFSCLPPSVALGMLYDLNSGALESAPMPKTMMAPKFDQRIRRKDGYQWASECDAKELRYHLTRAESSTNPEYAEKNAKEAKALGFWLRWRIENPAAIWRGERNREQVIAAMPSGKPEVHAWEAKQTEPQAELPALDDDDDIPF